MSLVDVHERTVLVRLTGNCHGCSMSQVTLKNTVEETLKQHIPEIESVQVVDDVPANLVQIQMSASAHETHWLAGPRVEDLPADRPYAFTV